jgi:hypothetical protein
MIVATYGSKSFDDYQVFLRGIGTALREIADTEDKDFTIFSAGPKNINEFVHEFMNVNERSLKAYGIKAKIVKVPPSWIEHNLNSINYLLYFSKPKETIPEVVTMADAKDIEVGVYRY